MRGKTLLGQGRVKTVCGTIAGSGLGPVTGTETLCKWLGSARTALGAGQAPAGPAGRNLTGAAHG